MLVNYAVHTTFPMESKAIKTDLSLMTRVAVQATLIETMLTAALLIVPVTYLLAEYGRLHNCVEAARLATRTSRECSSLLKFLRFRRGIICIINAQRWAPAIFFLVRNLQFRKIFLHFLYRNSANFPNFPSPLSLTAIANTNKKISPLFKSTITCLLYTSDAADE